MDVERALKTAVSTGDVRLGTNMALKAIKEGKARLVVMAANCPGSGAIQSAASSACAAGRSPWRRLLWWSREARTYSRSKSDLYGHSFF